MGKEEEVIGTDLSPKLYIQKKSGSPLPVDSPYACQSDQHLKEVKEFLGTKPPSPLSE